MLIDLGTTHSRPAVGQPDGAPDTATLYCAHHVWGRKIHLASAGTLFIRELCHHKCLLTGRQSEVNVVGTVTSRPTNHNTFHLLSPPPLAHNYTWGRGVQVTAGPGRSSGMK
jgi:hypothetical protein